MSNLLVMEKFKRRIPYPFRIHLLDKQEENLLKAAQIADDYTLIRHNPSSNKPPNPSPDIKSNASAKPGNLDETSGLFYKFCEMKCRNIKYCKHPRCRSSVHYNGNESYSGNFTKPYVTSENKT